MQPFVTLLEARAVNDSGQILPQGLDGRNGQRHAYVLSPVTVAELLAALLGLGLAGLGLSRRRKAN